MTARPKGVWRLSIVSGGLGFLAGVGFIVWALMKDGPPPLTALAAVIILGIPLASFLAPFALVQGITWVIRGFMDDARSKKGEKP